MDISFASESYIDKIVNDTKFSKEEFNNIKEKQFDLLNEDSYHLFSLNVENMEFKESKNLVIFMTDLGAKIFDSFDKVRFVSGGKTYDDSHKKFYKESLKEIGMKEDDVEFDTFFLSVSEFGFPNARDEESKYIAYLKKYAVYFILRILCIKPACVIFTRPVFFELLMNVLQYNCVLPQVIVTDEKDFKVLKIKLGKQRPVEITKFFFIGHPFSILNQNKDKSEIETYKESIQNVVKLSIPCLKVEESKREKFDINKFGSPVEFIIHRQREIDDKKKREQIERNTFGTNSFKKEQNNKKIREDSRQKKKEQERQLFNSCMKLKVVKKMRREE